MSVSPDSKRYAEAVLDLNDGLNTSTRTVTARLSGGTTYPNAHMTQGQTTLTVTLSESTSGALPPAGTWAIAIVEDATDVGGNYTTAEAASAPVTGVVALRILGTGGALPASVTIGDLSGNGGASHNLAFTKRGFFRVVLIAADSENNARRLDGVSTGVGSTEYHFDSDNNNARGNLATNPNAGTQQIDGYSWRQSAPDTISYSIGGSLRYGQSFTVTVELLSGTYINPKQFKTAFRVGSADGSAQDQVYRATPSTAGSATFTVAAESGIRVDTDFAAAITAYTLHCGVNAMLGDATTPSAELPDFLASGTITGTTTAQRAWISWDTAATSTAFSMASIDRATSTATKTIASGIAIFEDTGGTIAGVAPFRTSGYTVRQDIFRRTGPTVTTDAVPFLETYVKDAYGAALASISVSATVRRSVDDVAVNTQTPTTDANGRIRWNYTIAATNPAFNRYVKIGATRQTGGHVATGPDNPASPPATFAFGNSDNLADYPGPYPGYPRNVRITGNVFSGAKEPSATDTNVFGTNSEIIFEDIWTGTLTAAALNGNGVPTGAGQREQQLGAGSLRAKLTTLINEGSVRVINLTEVNGKDVAGRNLVVTTDNLFLRKATFNDTTDAIHEAPTNLSDSQAQLNNAVGYHSGNNSLDTIGPPVDPASLIYYQGASDTQAQRATFDLTVSGTDPVPGFTGDVANFGYFAQPVSFIAIDTTIKLLMTAETLQTEPTLVRRFVLAVKRITADAEIDPINGLVDAPPDTAPIFWVIGQPATGAVSLVTAGTATIIGGPPSANYEFTVTIPQGFKSIKVFATAKVNGSRTVGGDVNAVQVGFEFDAVDFAVGFPFR